MRSSSVVWTKLFKQKSRSIVDIPHLKGMRQSIRKDKYHLSPLNGVVFKYTGLLNHLYGEEKSAYATTRLVNSLFFKLGQQFRSIQSKSFAAYSLSPAILAKIMHHLDNNTLSESTVKQKISKDWREHHNVIAGPKTKISTKKTESILDLIILSKQECVDKVYPISTTENILLSFLYIKSTTRQEMLTYLTELNKLTTVIDETNGLLQADAKYNEEDVEAGLDLIKNFVSLDKFEQERFLEKHLENILVSVIIKNSALGQVQMYRYGFQNRIPRPNCVEAAFHNLCNILLYDNQKATFDFSLLSAKLKPAKELVSFYEMQEFASTEINSSKVGQAFMNLLSNHAKFKYRQESFYELISTEENFIPIMNYLFGSNATSLKELSAEFSDNEKQILFEKDNGGFFSEDVNVSKINIHIKNKDRKPIKCRFEFIKGTYNHAELVAPDFEKNEIKESNIFINKIVNSLFDYIKVDQLPDLFSTLCFTNKQYLYRLFLTVNSISLDKLITVMFYAPPDSYFQAYSLLQLMLPYLKSNSTIQEYAANLLKKYSGNLLITAMLNNNFAVIRYYLELNLDLNVHGIGGNTLLHLVDDLNLLDLLLKKGANPNLVNEFKKTPLHCARTAEIADRLLKAGADPKAAAKYGNSPLHLASSISIIETLIQGGADPNQPNEDGNTPLHMYLNDLSVFHVLLTHGADLSIKNNSGKTPVDYLSKVMVDGLIKRGHIEPLLLQKQSSMQTVPKFTIFNQWQPPVKEQAETEKTSSIVKSRYIITR